MKRGGGGESDGKQEGEEKSDGKQEGKETVLIIDDLDRIDPEHIFRLLNVFAAHFDIEEGRNKFGFDRVVFVCDYENLRQIFAHRYGERTDFSGYIDKFFSNSVYYFMNEEAIEGSVWELINRIMEKIPDSALDFYGDPLKHDFGIWANLEFLFVTMVKENKLTLRKLIKINKKPIIIEEINPEIHEAVHSIFQMEGLLFLNILLQLFDEWDLRSILSELYTRRYTSHKKFVKKMKRFAGSLLTILSFRKHNFVQKKTTYSDKYEWQEVSGSIQYLLKTEYVLRKTAFGLVQK